MRIKIDLKKLKHIDKNKIEKFKKEILLPVIEFFEKNIKIKDY